MSSPTLTLDELLAEVERVHGNQPQGVSMRELCAAVGHTAKWVSDACCARRWRAAGPGSWAAVACPASTAGCSWSPSTPSPPTPWAGGE
jgi:hypothetical protein